jgi:hypothetical protein
MKLDHFSLLHHQKLIVLEKSCREPDESSFCNIIFKGQLACFIADHKKYVVASIQ